MTKRKVDSNIILLIGFIIVGFVAGMITAKYTGLANNCPEIQEKLTNYERFENLDKTIEEARLESAFEFGKHYGTCDIVKRLRYVPKDLYEGVCKFCAPTYKESKALFDKEVARRLKERKDKKEVK